MWVASSAFNCAMIFRSCGLNSVSPNRDAVCPACDSAPFAGSSASRTSAGSSSHTSSQVATSFAPCLMSVFGPQEFLFVTLPGTAKTSRFCSSALQRAARGDARAAIFSGFDDEDADGNPADDAVTNREILRRRECLQCKL